MSHVRSLLLMAAGLSSDAIGRLQRFDGGDQAVAFAEALVLRGSSSSTVRTYGLGLLHFLGWLASRGVSLGVVDRGLIVAYVADFARGERTGAAVGRAPATINHRVSVLASFFGFLIERDRLASDGRWAAGASPVPAGSAAMAGEDASPFAALAPPAVPLERHDLVGVGCEKARRRQTKRQAAAIVDLEREVPKLRALAARRWQDDDHAHRRV